LVFFTKQGAKINEGREKRERKRKEIKVSSQSDTAAPQHAHPV